MNSLSLETKMLRTVQDEIVKKTFAWFFIFACIAFVLSSETASAKPPFIGVFSNKAEGFSIKTIMLMDDGKGMICGGGGCGPVVWKLGATNGDIILDGPENDAKNILVHYDSTKKIITILDKKFAEDSGPLLFITNEVPNAKELQKKLRYFDGSQESLEPKGAVFARCATNHLADLTKLEKAIHGQDVPCKITGSPQFLLVYLRDFDQVRKIATKEMVHSKLSLQIRADKNTRDFEVWETGKKIHVETDTGSGVVNTVIPVNLD